MSTHTGWNDDTDIEQSPVASSSRPQSNYIPALPARRPDLPPALWQPAPSATSDAWRPTPAIIETSTPFERAKALMLRQLLLWCIWLILALAAALAAFRFAAISGPAAALFGLAVFGAAAAASFIALDRAERSDSATGLEKHRIDRAAELERLKLIQEHELRSAVIDSYIKRLED